MASKARRDQAHMPTAAQIVLHRAGNIAKNEAERASGGMKQFFDRTINRELEKAGINSRECAEFSLDYHSRKKSLYTRRRLNQPKLPKTIDEIDIKA